MDSPCHYCEKQGCGAYHSQCEKYIEYDKQRKSVYDKKEGERFYWAVINRRRRHTERVKYNKRGMKK